MLGFSTLTAGSVGFRVEAVVSPGPGRPWRSSPGRLGRRGEQAGRTVNTGCTRGSSGWGISRLPIALLSRARQRLWEQGPQREHGDRGEGQVVDEPPRQRVGPVVFRKEPSHHHLPGSSLGDVDSASEAQRVVQVGEPAVGLHGHDVEARRGALPGPRCSPPFAVPAAWNRPTAAHTISSLLPPRQRSLPQLGPVAEQTD